MPFIGYGYLRYLVYMLPALILAAIAQIAVKTTFGKYNRIETASRVTAAEAADRILRLKGINSVKVIRVQGSLTDRYDPRSNTVGLSQPVYGSDTIGAVGVAAHEVGHAIQHATGYFPIKIRSAILPICNFGSGISPYLMLIGLLFNIPVLYLAGIAAFSLVAVFQLVTLPVEFNASRRALSIISQYGILTGEEQKGAKKVLTAAAMTYVASLLTSCLQIFYYLSRFRNNSNNR